MGLTNYLRIEVKMPVHFPRLSSGVIKTLENTLEVNKKGLTDFRKPLKFFW
jgi:hypothetical protein